MHFVVVTFGCDMCFICVINGSLNLDSSKLLLEKMVEVTQKTKRTNFFSPDRYALSFRMDPTIMFTPNDYKNNKPRPYGMIFAHGRHFNGFHNRFRDIARGGLRIVTPLNADVYSLESSRHYDEVYGLSYAQQLKNKDIPEGGSKGVVLLNSPAIPEPQRNFAVRKSIKAFTDSILDLIVEDEIFSKNIVDHLGKSELIYLGPDEQVVPGDIDWIIQRAEQRGYPIPAAFMSSKQGAGINHKQYGVTSEGIAVFFDVAMRNVLGKDPKKEPFTIKITGGPDGDVGGNLMKILARDYGSNAKIVGIADGSGVAEDPKGLDHVREWLHTLFSFRFISD
jgi:glutamate dehydrogenase